MGLGESFSELAKQGAKVVRERLDALRRGRFAPTALKKVREFSREADLVNLDTVEGVRKGLLQTLPRPLVRICNGLPDRAAS